MSRGYLIRVPKAVAGPFIQKEIAPILGPVWVAYCKNIDEQCDRGKGYLMYQNDITGSIEYIAYRWDSRWVVFGHMPKEGMGDSKAETQETARRIRRYSAEVVEFQSGIDMMKQVDELGWLD